MLQFQITTNVKFATLKNSQFYVWRRVLHFSTSHSKSDSDRDVSKYHFSELDFELNNAQDVFSSSVMLYVCN